MVREVAFSVDQQETLGAFSSALNQEAHVLTRNPEILWQQMYNRLQWEGEDTKTGACVGKKRILQDI